MAHSRTKRVQAVFDSNFSRDREVGAALSIWQNGKEILNLHGGYRDAARQQTWQNGTLVLIWSATKGPAVACALHAIERAGLNLSTRMAEFWPSFAQAGKEKLTLGDVLSHRAGLSALNAEKISLMDYERVIHAIEIQAPLWELGEGHGYGPRVFGFILDEIVRRLAKGMPLGQYWRREFAEPLNLDLWIGLPESEHARVASMLAARAGSSNTQDPFLESLADPTSLTRKAFSSPTGLPTASSMNSPASRSASIPSFGGIGSASALAKFYSLLALGGSLEGRRFFAGTTMDWMKTRLSQGLDKVLHLETAFSAGFMMDPLDAKGQKIRSLFGPCPEAFGHPGAGGSLGFADPSSGVGFGYVMNQMESGVLPQERARSLVKAFYEPGVA